MHHWARTGKGSVEKHGATVSKDFSYVYIAVVMCWERNAPEVDTCVKGHVTGTVWGGGGATCGECRVSWPLVLPLAGEVVLIPSTFRFIPTLVGMQHMEF
jgi:hypothetical protein